MKTYFNLLTVIVLGLCLASCSKDDDEDNESKETVNYIFTTEDSTNFNRSLIIGDWQLVSTEYWYQNFLGNDITPHYTVAGDVYEVSDENVSDIVKPRCSRARYDSTGYYYYANIEVTSDSTGYTEYTDLGGFNTTYPWTYSFVDNLLTSTYGTIYRVIEISQDSLKIHELEDEPSNNFDYTERTSSSPDTYLQIYQTYARIK